MSDKANLPGSKELFIVRDDSLLLPPGEGSSPEERAAWVDKSSKGNSDEEGWTSRHAVAVEKYDDNGRIQEYARDTFEILKAGLFEADEFHWRNALGTHVLQDDERPRPMDRVWAHALVDDWRGNSRRMYNDRDHQIHHNAESSTMMVRRTVSGEFKDALAAPLSSILHVVATSITDVQDGEDHPMKAYMPKVALNITYHNRNMEKDAGYVVDMTPVGTDTPGSERWGQLAHIIKITALPGADFLGPANIDNRQIKRPDIRTTAHFWGKDWTDSSDSAGAEHGPLYLTQTAAVAPPAGVWQYGEFIWEDPDTASANPAPKGPAGYSKVIRPIFRVATGVADSVTPAAACALDITQLDDTDFAGKTTQQGMTVLADQINVLTLLLNESFGGTCANPILTVDVVNENTPGAGVTVDGVLMWDNDIYLTSGHYIYGNDGTALAMQFDVANGYVEMTVGAFMSPTIYSNIINEKTVGSGVTIDSVLLKDGGATFSNNVIIYKDGSDSIVTQTAYGLASDCIYNMRKARGTYAAPTVVADDDILARIIGYGYSANASAFLSAAEIRIEVDGVPDSGADTTDMPGRIILLTTPDGAAAPVERFRISQDGTLSANGSLIIGGDFTMHANSITYLSQYIYDASNGSVHAFLRSRGTEGGEAVVQDNDILGVINFYGYSAAAGGFNLAASIHAEIEGAPDSGGDTTDMPGALVFSTSPNGSATPVERLRIEEGGYVGIGLAGAAANEMLEVSGRIRTNTAFGAFGNIGVTGVWTVAVGDVVDVDGGIITRVVSGGWA